MREKRNRAYARCFVVFVGRLTSTNAPYHKPTFAGISAALLSRKAWGRRQRPIGTVSAARKCPLFGYVGPQGAFSGFTVSGLPANVDAITGHGRAFSSGGGRLKGEGVARSTVSSIRRDWYGLAAFCMVRLKMSQRQIGEMIEPDGEDWQQDAAGRVVVLLIERERQARIIDRYLRPS